MSNEYSETAKSVLRLIRGRTIDNPLSASQIIHRIAGLKSDAEIREIVHNARENGDWIGSNNEGYFLCRNFEEYKPTARHIHSRSMSMLSMLSQSIKNHQKNCVMTIFDDGVSGFEKEVETALNEGMSVGKYL